MTVFDRKQLTGRRIVWRALGLALAMQAVAMVMLAVILPQLSGWRYALFDAALVLLPLALLGVWYSLRRNHPLPELTESQVPPMRTALHLTITVMLLGVLVSLVAARWFSDAEDERQKLRFKLMADRVEEDVIRRFAIPLSGINGLRSLFLARSQVSREEFKIWIESRNLPVEFPGVRAFAFVQTVPRDRLADFVTQTRGDGAPEFSIKSAGEHDPLQVVKFIEPQMNNRSALGFDLNSEPRRREVIQRAVDTGEVTLSPPLALLQSKERGPGVLLVAPVYRLGSDPSTPAQRRAALIGLVDAPLVLDELFAGAVQATQGLAVFDLFDGPEMTPESLLFARSTASSEVTETRPAGSRLEARRDLRIGGRKLTLRVQSTAAFASERDQAVPTLVGLGGLMLTLLLSVTVWLLGSGRERAERLAQAMTTDLQRLAKVVERTANAVIVTDRDLKITWVNDGFTRVYGYTLEQALGQTPAELLGSGKTDPGTIRKLMDAARQGVGVRVDVINRTREGQERWIDVEVQPTFNSAGKVDGFIEIALDITEQKATNARLAAALRESDALLRTIDMHAIVSIADPAGRITFANEAFVRVSGYSLQELMGQDHRVVNSGKQAPGFWRDVWRSIASGQTWRGQICNRAKNGELYWVDSVIAPFFGGDGRIEKYVSIRTDITGIKLAEQRLTQLADRLNVAIEGGSGGLWDWMDVSVGEQWWSPSLYELLGYGVGELSSTVKTIKSVLHPEHVEPTFRAIETALAGGAPMDVEYLLRNKSGEYRWYRGRAKVFFDDSGKARRMAGSIQDIHDRKQAERELGRERERLSSIIEGTDVGTWEWSVTTGEAHYNERWAAIIGYSLQELAPLSPQTWRSHVHADDLRRADALMQRHFAGELPRYECEVRMRHRAGHWVWVLTRGKVGARNADGSVRWMAGIHMDITDRKLAEQRLQASEAFLDRAGRMAGVGGWQVDLETGNAMWTAQTRLIHEVDEGYALSREGLFDFFAPSSRLVIEEAWRDAVENQTPFDLELPFVTAKGREIWVRTVGEVELEDGRPARVVGAIQDVSSWRALEDEMRRSNELLENILHHIPVGLSVFDDDLLLVMHNAKMAELLGIEQHLLVDRQTRMEDVLRYNAKRGEYGEGDVEELVQQGLRRVGRPVVPHRFERTRPNGTVLDIRGAPLPGGGFVTTYTDITEQRQAQRNLEESERILRGAIDTLDEAFVLFDNEDRLVFCNEKYRTLYSESADLIVPGATFEHIVRQGALRGQYTDAIGRVDEWVAERMHMHRQDNVELTQRLSNGKWIRIVESRTADGYRVGFRIDITQLREAVDAAEQSSRSKSQFLANMSHEIRTPMNAILGMLQLLRGTELAPRQLDYAQKAEGAARSLLGLLNDILDFSKVEAGKMLLDPQPFNLDKLLNDLSVILSANLGQKNVEILFDVDAALPRQLVGDAMRLQQILINLCGNAVKFTQQGEVVLALKLRDRQPNAVSVDFEVRDSGIGISPEHQAHIFDGFSQAEASTTRRFGGTGLGLAISQRLARLMGAELRLESAPGQGSTFSFNVRFELAEGALAGDVPGLPAPSAVSRVLVVDDNASARDVMASLARSLGWQVDLARSGEEALQLLMQGPTGSYQAVFMDWSMPGMDGWETSRQIRALLTSEPAPVIVMVTAHGREQLAQRAQSEQGLLDGVLIKPVTASMLLQAMAGAHQARVPQVADGKAPTGRRRLQGLRLLLAEDNVINQQVARELLEREGAQVQVANHGADAVAAVQRAQPLFDAVLMDLQMPVMDGLSATREIRQKLGLASLPVIAMTANAMSSDRDDCLAAGMNDHVGKPFDLEHLVQTLLRYTRPGAEAAWPAPTETTAHSADEPAPWLETEATVRRLGGDQELYRALLRTFLKDLNQLPAQMQQAMEAANDDELPRFLHSVKGMCSTVGAQRLAQWAQSAEVKLQNGQSLQGHRDELAFLVQQTEAALQFVQPVKPEVSRPMPLMMPVEALVDPDPALVTAIDELAALLSQGDMQALQAWESLRDRHAPVLGAALESIDGAIGSLDFSSALQHLDPIRKQLAP